MRASQDAARGSDTSALFDGIVDGGVGSAGARLRTKELRRLWDKFTPPVTLIFPVWDASRWKAEFDKSVDRKQAGRDLFVGFREDQKTASADWLVGLGSLVATGDMYALQYFLLMMNSLHGTRGVRLREAWSLSNGLWKADGVMTPAAQEVLGQNIIVIGGPAGNPIAQILLDELKAGSLFPDAPKSDFRIRKWGKLDTAEDGCLSPKIGTGEDQTDEDCGLLLVGRNPWSKDKSKWFMAAMGSASWGTQACASLACSEAGASDLAKSRVGPDPTIGDAEWVGEIGYVKVWPKAGEAKQPGRLPDLTVPDSRFQMVFPLEGGRHTNPESILNAGEMLRVANRGPVIGFRPAVLIAAICCLCLASAAIVIGVLSRHLLGPITFAVSFAAAGAVLIPRSLGVGQRLARLDTSPSNSPPA